MAGEEGGTASTVARSVSGYDHAVSPPASNANPGDASSPRDWTDLLWRTAPVLLLALHAALAWLGRAPGFLTGQDDSRYLVLARSLRHGQYRELMWPGAPLERMYPPGYPSLLALWTTIGGEAYDWLIVLNIVLTTAALALVLVVSRRQFGRAVALCTLAILAVNPGLLEFAGNVFSEAALAFCFAVGVYAATCLAPSRRQVAIVIVAALAAVLMRMAGIVIVGAVIVTWLFQRRYRDAMIAAALFAVVIVPFLIFTMNPEVGAGNSYAGDIVAGGRQAIQLPLWKLMAQRIATNAVGYSTRSLPWMLPVPTVPNTMIDNLIATVVVMVGLGAGIAVALRRVPVAALILLGSMALFLVWPYQLDRYLVPLMPLLVLTLLAGLAMVARKLHVGPRPVLVAVTLLIAGTGATRTSQRVAQMQSCDRTNRLPDLGCVRAEHKDFFRALPYLRDSLPTGAVVVSAKSGPLYLYTGHVSLPLEQLPVRDSARFWSAVRERGAEYVLASTVLGSEPRVLGPLLTGRCRHLALVAAFAPRAFLFRVLPDGPVPEGANPAGACEAVARYVQEAARDHQIAGPPRAP